MYPDGFVPFINGDIDDRYGILGYRTRIGEWAGDFSQTYGYNRMRYTIAHTLNASIANLDLINGGKGVSPNSQFDAGGFSFRQLTTNADFSRFYGDVLGGLNAAFGFEYRPRTTRSSPANRVPTSTPTAWASAAMPAARASRASSRATPPTATATAAPPTSTSKPTSPTATKLQGALRHERYSDFGSTTTGKLAGAFKATDDVLLRASASTGFRAPSLQQVYFSSTFTDFVSGVPMDVVLAPNGGAVANAAGIPKLKEEKSKSFTWARPGRRRNRPPSRPTCTTSTSTTASCCRAASTPTTTRRWAPPCSRWAWARPSSS
jgi:iron complex outermembrane receptor protein